MSKKFNVKGKICKVSLTVTRLSKDGTRVNICIANDIGTEFKSRYDIGYTKLHRVLIELQSLVDSLLAEGAKLENIKFLTKQWSLKGDRVHYNSEPVILKTITTTPVTDGKLQLIAKGAMYPKYSRVVVQDCLVTLEAISFYSWVLSEFALKGTPLEELQDDEGYNDDNSILYPLIGKEHSVVIEKLTTHIEHLRSQLAGYVSGGYRSTSEPPTEEPKFVCGHFVQEFVTSLHTSI